MAVVLYRDINYEGPAARLAPGVHTSSGCDLHPETCSFQGKGRATSYGENLDNKVSSLRVPAGFVVALYRGYSELHPGDGRTFIGPVEVPDLSVYGFDDKTSAARVARYDPHGVTAGGATLYSQQYARGQEMKLPQGDYDQARLSSDESSVIFEPLSVCVAPGALAVLYAGPNFELSQPSVLVGGENRRTCVEDLVSLMGVSGLKPKSVRVLAAVGGLPPPAAPALQPAQASGGWTSLLENPPAAAPADTAAPSQVIIVKVPDAAPAATPGLIRILLVLMVVLLAVLGIAVANPRRRLAGARKTTLQV